MLVKLMLSPFGYWLDRLVVRWFGGSLINYVTARAFGYKPGAQPVLLLVTRGKRSGKRRSAVLPVYTIDGKRVVVGSKGGSPTDPGWVHNLRHQAEVTLYVERRRLAARARESQGAERVGLWAELTAKVPLYADYETRAGRQIPVVVLDPQP
jgi:deazaflavin-dependent oxidoreductase (nitroreductase family)